MIEFKCEITRSDKICLCSMFLIQCEKVVLALRIGTRKGNAACIVFIFSHSSRSAGPALSARDGRHHNNTYYHLTGYFLMISHLHLSPGTERKILFSFMQR